MLQREVPGGCSIRAELPATTAVSTGGVPIPGRRTSDRIRTGSTCLEGRDARPLNITLAGVPPIRNSPSVDLYSLLAMARRVVVVRPAGVEPASVGLGHLCSVRVTVVAVTRSPVVQVPDPLADLTIALPALGVAIDLQALHIIPCRRAVVDPYIAVPP